MQQYDERLMSVMAPLVIANEAEFAKFETHLQEASAIGIEAVSVDVWWGRVHAERNAPCWDYYDRVFAAIQAQGLAIVPIMSFHRCGGGANDPPEPQKNVPLPTWLGEFVKGEGGSPEDLCYQSETGNESFDAIPPWLGEEVPAIYREMVRFLDEFLERYRPLLQANLFPEINISLGPSGELRYPSYSATDHWQFPHRGYYQCYSESARRSFLRWVRDPKNHCSWADQFSDAEIRVPNGHVPRGHGARADAFVTERIHLQPGYGQDFCTWYHQSLVDHGRRLLHAAIRTLLPHCTRDIELAPLIGMKIPGVHWQWRSTGVPRYAELTAGLIPPHCCFVPEAKSATGYESIFEMVRELKLRTAWPIRVHFTALEMDDDTLPDSSPNATVKTSMARSLVSAVGRTAYQADVLLSGENALDKVDAPDKDDEVASWDYVAKAFDSGYFSGFTLLRLCDGAWDTDKNAMEQFIKHYDRDGGIAPPRSVFPQSSSVKPGPAASDPEKSPED